MACGDTQGLAGGLCGTGNGIRSRGLLCAATAAALGLGQDGAVVLRDPGVYGVAIAAGYCFFAAGMYCFARLMLADSPNRRLAATAAC